MVCPRRDLFSGGGEMVIKDSLAVKTATIRGLFQAGRAPKADVRCTDDVSRPVLAGHTETLRLDKGLSRFVCDRRVTKNSPRERSKGAEVLPPSGRRHGRMSILRDSQNPANKPLRLAWRDAARVLLRRLPSRSHRRSLRRKPGSARPVQPRRTKAQNQAGRRALASVPT
jgi:hypothetical protein